MTDETTTVIEVPADYNVDELLDWVDEDPEARAPAALTAEYERDPSRKGVLEVLEPLVEEQNKASEPGDDVVPERTPADVEAELVVELQKTGDDRDQSRIDALVAELGPQPGPAGPTEDAPAPPAFAGPQVDGPIFMSVSEGVKVGDNVVTGGVGYEVVSGPDGTTVAVDETGAVTEIL